MTCFPLLIFMSYSVVPCLAADSSGDSPLVTFPPSLPGVFHVVHGTAVVFGLCCCSSRFLLISLGAPCMQSCARSLASLVACG